MTTIASFSDEQARALINLEQRYQVWMEAEQVLFALPYDLRRKEVSGRSYLYEIFDRSGNGKSLGPWSDECETTFAEYHALKKATKARRDASRRVLDETGRLCRALRTPMLADAAGSILREADRRRLLGKRLLVVGTNVLSAYALEAGGFIRDAPDETQDVDLAWAATEPATEDQAIWPMLKAVDPTYTVNVERTFQARSAGAYEIVFVVAPSRAETVGRRDQPRPIALPEQEWLLFGRPVDRVVICRDGSAARIVAPDPRWFALQKLWLAQKPSRDSLKRPKDRKQGLALLDAIREAMPQYPLDAAFEDELPDELAPLYAGWKRGG